MKARIVYLSLLLLLMLSMYSPNQLFAQTRFGAGTQIYPAGLIGFGQVGIPVSDQYDIRFMVGYNATNRRDFGKHDDEKGGGPGLGIEFIRFFSNGKTGLFAGAGADLWILEIDWKDETQFEEEAGAGDGTTNITVFQPAGMIGYRTGSRSSRRVVEFTMALGAEINVKTSGEPVGEGAIVLAGITLIF